MAVMPYQPSNIPPALAERGVRFIETSGGARLLDIPAALRAEANVLLPVSEIAQADPLWQPSVRWLQLDIEKNTYPGQKDGELALSKNGVLALAEAAGIEVVSTTRMDRGTLMPTEFGWQATVRVRRGDGTWRHFTASKIIDVEDEKLAIDLQVRTGKFTKDKPEDAKVQAIAKRLATEKPHWNAKAETKAILRAVRAVLQLPPAYTRAELGKPFVVVGWNLTLDYNDPEQRAAAIEHGLTGQRSAAGQLYALPAADDTAADHGDVIDVDAHERPDGVDEHGEIAPTGWGATAAAAVDEAADAGYEPDQPEPAVAAPRGKTDAEKVADAAGATIIHAALRKHAGKTVAAVHVEEPGYLVWIASPKFAPKSDQDRDLKQKVGDYLYAVSVIGGQS